MSSHAITGRSSQTMTEFCEQVDPKLLVEMRRTPAFGEMRRVQESWVAAAEKRLLVWLAGRTPQRIGPDHLTALGLAAQLGAGACYALAVSNRYWLLGVIVCLALNWLGDSLDGTLARERKQLRPRYGFYVDHMVDSFGALALMGGLALSGYMHPTIAIGLLIAFLMLSIQSYLATHALGEFRLSFWRFGPTELRILLAVGNLALLWKPQVHFEGQSLQIVRRRRSGRSRRNGSDAVLLHRTKRAAALPRREDRKVIGKMRGGTVVRWLKFNAVGALGIGVQLAVLLGLKSGLHLNYLPATALAVEAAVVHNFLWHERYTWADRVRASWPQSLLRFARFNLTTGAVSIGGNLAMMKLLVDWGQVNYLLANGISILVCSLLNFLVSEEWVFAKEERSDPSMLAVGRK